MCFTFAELIFTGRQRYYLRPGLVPVMGTTYIDENTLQWDLT